MALDSGQQSGLAVGQAPQALGPKRAQEDGRLGEVARQKRQDFLFIASLRSSPGELFGKGGEALRQTSTKWRLCHSSTSNPENESHISFQTRTMFWLFVVEQDR